MLRRMRPKLGRRLYVAASVALLLIVAVVWALLTGFATDIGFALLYRLSPCGVGSAPPIDFGPASLEERILQADMVARVRLRSVSQVVEKKAFTWTHDNGEWGESYATALEFKFEVLEYLRGRGGGEVVGIVNTDLYYLTKLGARAFGGDITEIHDTAWDDREAIVFLRKSIHNPSTVQPDRYVLGAMSASACRGISGDGYTIDAHRFKMWLPAADGGENVSLASAGGGGQGMQRFLTGAQSAEGESYDERIDYRVASNAHNEALGTGGDSSTIALSKIKGLIEELEAEVAEGDGSEEYRQCVYEKYKYNREVEYRGQDSYYTEVYDHQLGSGLPADTIFAFGSKPFRPPENFSPADIYVGNLEWERWLEGKDAHLFHVVDDKSLVGNARPLPEDEYRFYYHERDAKYIPCDVYPDKLRTRWVLVVDVIAPADVLHEAFFDPVAIDGAVGADSENGVLQPYSFQTDGGKSAIERIEWRDDGQVEMTLSPPITLDGHRMDFIALDGAVSLRLGFDDAIQVQNNGGISTLAWGVCEQPWQSGDLLMLRIAEGIPNDGVQATSNAECGVSAAE